MSQRQFEPTQPLEAAETLAPPGKARGFFGRHLHGDFPLARSYRVHMLLLQSLAAGVALALIPWLSQNMRKIEVFALFERRSPALYRSAMDLAWQKMQRGASDAEVIGTVRESLMPNLVKLLPLATDPTLLAYHDVMIDELQALQARDTAACAELAFASGHAMKAVGAIPQELGKREQVRIFAGPAVRQASTPMAVCASARVLRERAGAAASGAGPGAAGDLWQRMRKYRSTTDHSLSIGASPARRRPAAG